MLLFKRKFDSHDHIQDNRKLDKEIPIVKWRSMPGVPKEGLLILIPDSASEWVMRFVYDVDCSSSAQWLNCGNVLDQNVALIPYGLFYRQNLIVTNAQWFGPSTSGLSFAFSHKSIYVNFLI